MSNRKKHWNTKFATLLLSGIALVALAGCSPSSQVKSSVKKEATVWMKNETKSSSSGTPIQATSSNTPVDYGKTTDAEPTQSLAQSVLTPAVVTQLGGQKAITYDGQGSFYINKDQVTLTLTSDTGIIQSGKLNQLGQLSASSATLVPSMYGKRDNATHDWEPAGYHQLHIDAPTFDNYLWNKGHSIGDVLVAGWTGASTWNQPITATAPGQWNASEYYACNVTTQTAWANQADGGQYESDGYGQNYFEGKVRDVEKESGEVIAYRVTPIYDGNNLVPSGNWIQAKDNHGKVDFNVFIPNVQMGVKINYATGEAEVAQ